MQGVSTILAAVFAAVLGGCIGSFLNVVVWRLPNRMSLVRPASFCPKCRHPIRFYDNVPVFGWLFLGGKCRDCREPISFRYPAVEFTCAVTAVFFAWLVFQFGWCGGGENLFGFQWQGTGGFWEDYDSFLQGNLYFAPSWEWYFLTGFGMTLLWSILFYLPLGIGLIAWDGLKVPKSLWGIWIFLALLLMPLGWGLGAAAAGICGCFLYRFASFRPGGGFLVLLVQIVMTAWASFD